MRSSHHRHTSGTHGRRRRFRSPVSILSVLAASCITASMLVVVPIGVDDASAAANHAPIKIGIVCSCLTALASSNGIAVPGIEAWADSVNAKGGINGHKVDLIEVNDEASPAQALPLVEKLVTQDHVIAIGQISDATSAFTTYLQQQHIPVIGLGSEAVQDYTSPDFFSPGQTESSGAISTVDSMKLSKVTKIALLYCAESPACSETIPSEEQALKSAGMDASYVTAISSTLPSYAAQCLAAKQSGAQAIAVGDGSSVVETIATNCHSQGYNPVWIQGDGSLAGAFTTTPGLETDTISAQPDAPWTANTPGVKAMNAAFNKYEPSLLKNPDFNELSLQAWVTGLLFNTAATAGKLGVNGPPTAQELYNGLYSLKGNTLGGMAPPLTFKKGQPNPINCWYYMKISNGHFTTPYGLKATCAKS
jgi:branched-chain amino acid transport system substrate-binding protein